MVESPASLLCKSCGLCCDGHLFTWVRLRAFELDRAEAIGLNVIRSDPRQRGFTQPCPLWNGQCTIYNSLDYPQGCRSYRCKLLKQVEDEKISLPSALEVVQEAKHKTNELATLLPDSLQGGFRERFVAYIENMKRSGGNSTPVFQARSDAFLAFLAEEFGVADFFDSPREER